MITASPKYEGQVLTRRSIGLVGTRFDVLPPRETAGIGDNALTCDDIVTVGAGPTSCHSEGPDTIGVTECNYAEASQHGYAGVRTLGLFHKSSNGVEYIFFVDPKLARLLEIVSENVE